MYRAAGHPCVETGDQRRGHTSPCPVVSPWIAPVTSMLPIPAIARCEKSAHRASSRASPVTAPGARIRCTAATADQRGRQSSICRQASRSTPPATCSSPRALLDLPTGITINAAGDLFIAESGDLEIQEVTPAGSIIRVAGDDSTCLAYQIGRAHV